VYVVSGASPSNVGESCHAPVSPLRYVGLRADKAAVNFYVGDKNKGFVAFIGAVACFEHRPVNAFGNPNLFDAVACGSDFIMTFGVFPQYHIQPAHHHQLPKLRDTHSKRHDTGTGISPTPVARHS
jgi:hypothetical protein